MRNNILALFLFIISLSTLAAGPAGITSGLRLWLDAGDTTTMFTDTACTGGNEVTTHGDAVNCWQDKSGNGNHAKSAIGSPLWVDDGGNDAVEFTSDRMDISGASGGAVFPNGYTVIETEVFFVARTRTITNGWGFGSQNGGRRYGTHFPWSNNNVYFDVGVCCTQSRVSAAWGGSSSFLHTWNFISDDGTPNYQAIYRDGTLVTSDAVADRITWGTNNFEIGAYGTGYQQMNASEFIIYDRRLTPTERDQVKNYLLNKWKEPIAPADGWTEGATKTITAPSGTDRLLVVVLGFEDNATNTFDTVSYGGVAMTKAMEVVTGNTFSAGTSIWYLLDADIDSSVGTAITYTTTNGATVHTDYASAVYTNIDQANPIYSVSGIDDGESGLDDLDGQIDVTKDGLTIISGQNGNVGTWGTNLTTVINHSGNSTSQVVGTQVEAADELNRTISISHTNNLRMGLAAVHFRSNTLPEVVSIQAISTSDTSINLTWDTVASVPNYRIAYQVGSTAPGNCELGTTIDAGNIDNYQVTGLTAATEYSFRVCANSGTSYTNGLTASATTDTLPPDSPNEALGVNLTINGPDSVSYSWVSGGGGTTGHRLAYKLGATAPTDCISDTQVDMGSGTTYNQTGLTALTQYSYRICAYNGTPLYTTGLTGTFTTPGITSPSSEVYLVTSWASGPTRTTFGSAQNRALIFIIGYDGGSNIASINFGGQAMSQIENRTETNTRTEMWGLTETQIQALVAPMSLNITFTGGGPSNTIYSSVVLGNVRQAPLTSDVNNAGGNLTTDNLILNKENGGLSVVGSSTARNNGVGSIDTGGWQTGIIQSNAAMGFASTYLESTAGGSHNVDISFSGAAARISMIGAHFALADPTDPVNFTVTSKSDVTVNLSWTSGLGSTSGFRIAYQAGVSAPVDCSTSTDVGDVTTYALTGLTASTEYGIRLCPYNVQGDQTAGQTLQVITAAVPLAAPNEISSLDLNTVSDTKIALNWLNGAGSTDSFQVAYLAGGSAPADCSLGTTVNAGMSTAYQVTGLTENTLYSFRVCSKNADGVYSAGLTISGTTDASAPTPSSSIAGSWQTGLTRTMDAGSNRVLIFAVSSEDTVDADVTAVTYGGVNLTHASTGQSSYSTTDFNRVELWYLLEADIQSASGTAFVPTWSNGALNRRYYAHAVFQDIDQASAIYHTANSSFSNGINPLTDTVNALTGGTSIAAATTSNNGTYTVNGGWTFGSEQNGNSSSLGTGHYFSLTDGVDTGNYTHTVPGRSAFALMHLKPAEPPPTELSGLVGNAVNSSTIKLDWTNGGGTTSGFRLAYKLGATAPATCFLDTQSNLGLVTTKQISALSASTQYSFRVCAYNASGEYTTGQTVTVTTSLPATTWTGAAGTNWFNAGSWDNGVPGPTIDCIVPNVANDPIIDGTIGDGECKNLTLTSPIQIDGSSTPNRLSGYGIISISGAASITGTNGAIAVKDNSTATQTLSSTVNIPILELSKTSGGALSFSTDISTDDIVIGGSANFTLNINNGIDFNISDNFTIPTNLTVDIKQGGVLNISNGNTLTVAGGTLKTSGVIDTSLSVNPGYSTSQAHIGTVGGTGSFALLATSGTLNFTGVNINRLNQSGVQVSGSASISNFNGVHLTNTQGSAGGQALSFNSTGSFPASAQYFGFDVSSTQYGDNGTYYVARAPGNCGSGNHTMTFVEWYGNFYSQSAVRISDNAPTCDIVMDISASPITLSSVQINSFSDGIVLEWRTTAEILHQGFNIYRSENQNSGFIKINDELILNSIFSVSYAGEYRYIDSGVEPGKIYYYILEDLATNGDIEQHGPYQASLDPIMGSVPTYADDLNQYTGNNSFEDSKPNTQNNNLVNLAPGVNLYYLPNGALRVHIKPPQYNSADSAWNASYKDLTIPSYVKLSEEDKPALPFTEVLIPIETSATNISSTISSKDDRIDSILPAPAPGYTVVSGNLVADYEANAAAYSSSILYPQSEHIKVATQSIELSGKNYIKVTVYPHLFKGSDTSLTVLEELYLDLSFDEASSSYANGSSYIAFNSLERNGVRIYHTQAGHYKVSYNDLFEYGLDTAFEGVQHSQLELTYKGKSIPLYIDKVNEEFFGEGDNLIFYAPFDDIQYTIFDSVLLSINESHDGLKYKPVYNETIHDIYEVSYTKELKYEQDNPSLFINNRSLGNGVDHYFWARVYLETGDSTYPAASKFCTNVDLDGINSNEIKISLNAATFSNLSILYSMDLEVFFSSDPTEKLSLNFEGTQVSSTEGIYTFNFTPSATEELCFTVKPFSGIPTEYFIADINQFSLSYEAVPTINTNEFSNLEFATGYSVPYDQSRGYFHLLQDEPDGHSYIYKYYEMDEDNIYFKTQGHVSSESKFKIAYDAELLTPNHMSWIEIEGDKLDDLASADLLIISNKKFIDELQILADHKKSMGLETEIVDQQFIYDHYSFGRADPQAIKDFLKSVNTYYGKKLKYILFAMDATVDPRNYNALEEAPRSAVHISASNYHDYASDNWFTKDGYNFYDFAIGRLPVNNEIELAKIVNKIIEYETNIVDTYSNEIAFTYSIDNASDFEAATLNYSSKATLFQKTYVDLSVSAGDALETQMNEKFLVNYMGHGNEYEIGTTDLDFTDVENMTNSKYPIFVALNCLTNYYASADPTDQGLGEYLLLKEDTGAIGVIAANTLLSPIDQSTFANYFYDELNRTNKSTNKNLRLGDILKNTHKRLTAASASNSQTDSIFLLGDPSLRLPASMFQKPKARSSAGGGCSAVASDGYDENAALNFLLEMLTLLLIAFVIRKNTFKKQ